MSHTSAPNGIGTPCPRRLVVALTLLLATTLALLTGCAGCSPERRTTNEEEPALPEQPQIRASRLFAGPDQYPPKRFAAYGILAFQSTTVAPQSDRYMTICQGFLESLPAAPELESRGVPIEEQMATIWPLCDGDLANKLNSSEMDNQERCRDAVKHIDLITSRDAIKMARRARNDQDLFRDAGPYLIAWSPSTHFGESDVPLLILDLSNAKTITQARDWFIRWADDIEENPGLWRGGWDWDHIVLVVRHWADNVGSGILLALKSRSSGG